jgi:hypothetical protein
MMSEEQLKNGKNGWRLHTYQATGNVAVATAFVNHYLLFKKGE